MPLASLDGQAAGQAGRQAGPATQPSQMSGRLTSRPVAQLLFVIFEVFAIPIRINRERELLSVGEEEPSLCINSFRDRTNRTVPKTGNIFMGVR